MRSIKPGMTATFSALIQNVPTSPSFPINSSK
jgi:hypothetical protein